MHKMLTTAVLLFISTMAAAEPLRITAFGDSLVHGYGLPTDQGLVPQLQVWLQENGADVVLTNAGVSGDTTAGGAARIDWTLSDNPQGLIILLGGNDMLRGMKPENAKTNLAAILTAAQAQNVDVLLIGMQAPGNFGPDYKVAFEAIYSDLATQFGSLLFKDAFTGISNQVSGDPVAAQKYLQDDGIHPNVEGVALNVAALGPVALQLVERISK
ncbi:arylesterase [Parasedimentitalea huanghaiensis]|uniref:Arylesterase n=1 Tax=Parasedimentitalea huanghaiensis TaxID=2682100 RepID=A0A6L6WHI5_9RHOB|nr:arylesterase [Zongyanglinia huanghaiensis]MVO17174.1 arylesterase [Zongyanglinia huanghaiensis]